MNKSKKVYNMIPTWLNKVNIYIFAWCIYYSQNLLFSGVKVFMQLLVVVLLMVSLYYFFVANTRYKLPDYFCGLNVLLGLLTVYGCCLMIEYNPAEYAIPVNSFNYLKRILISIIPIYPFYVFAKEGLIDEKKIQTLFFILLVVTIANYYGKQSRMLYAAMLMGSNKEEFTSNVGYEFLSLIPFCVFFRKKPVIQYISLGVCVIFLFMAMKRGAILIGAICLFWFLWKNINNVSIKQKVSLLVLAFLLSFISFLFVKKQMEDSWYFQKRIEDTLEGKSSNRDVLYSRFSYYFLNETTPLQFIFGSGANATLKVYNNYAHNDWLEIAVNQGLLGIFVYLFYWIIFFMSARLKKIDQSKRLAMQLILISTFLQTLFSMSYGSWGYTTMLVLAFCLTRENNHVQIGNSSESDKK